MRTLSILVIVNSSSLSRGLAEEVEQRVAMEENTGCIRSRLPMTAPPIMSELPATYFVVLWTMRSAPKRSGFCK